jgi:Rrf2 family protein
MGQSNTADAGARLPALSDNLRLERLAVLTQARPALCLDGSAHHIEGILRQLRQAGIVASQRGALGGYRLDRSPVDITIADIVRALDGPLAAVRGQRPEDLEYSGAAEHLREVWIAVRASMRHVLERTTLADVAQGTMPEQVSALIAEPGAWQRR